MAKKMKRVLALVIALALTAGQLMVPAMAEEAAETSGTEVTVNVTVLPEAPAAEPQAPAPSADVAVNVEAPVTTTNHDASAGVIEQSTSTTTTWTDTTPNDGVTTSGTETVTTVTGTDDYNGSKLYEGGSIAGSETTTTTETSTDTQTTPIVTEEISQTTDATVTEKNSETITDTTPGKVTEEGEWVDGTKEAGTLTEGDFTPNEGSNPTTQVTGTEDVTLDAGTIPEGGVTIELKPDTTTTAANDFSGTYSEQIIPLEEGMEIPKDAELIYDTDGKTVVGYKLLLDTKETITDSTETPGAAQADAESSVTDTAGTTASVAPDLDALKSKGYDFHEDSVITKDGDTYVVTNTYTDTYTGETGVEAMERPEAGTTTDADGNTTVITVEDILDDSGNVIGFTSRKTITDAEGSVIEDVATSQTIVTNEAPEAAKPVTTFTPPVRPDESTNTDADGITTTVTVSEIRDDAGDLIGYKSTTVKTDANGAELYRAEEDIYGVTTTVTESVEVGQETLASQGTTGTITTTETYYVTADQTIYNDIAAYTRLTEVVNDMTVQSTYEIVEVEGKLYVIYSGTMEVSEGQGHGDITGLTPVAPQSSLLNGSDKVLAGLQLNGTTNYSEEEMDNTNVGIPADGFRFTGLGLRSTLGINYDGGDTMAYQFKLTNNAGETYYAMCIDLDTGAQPGYFYDIVDITSQDYFQSSGNANVESAEKIRSIALNGYWGTADDANSTEDVGSLDEVKNLVKTYLMANGKTEAEANSIINALTPGQALAATQAALWTYGAKNDREGSPINADNIVKGDSGTNETMVQYVYDALIAAANDENAELAANEGVEFLDAEDITGGAITVKSKVVSADENHVNNDDNPDNDTYNTDIGFTLGIEPSKLNGDLIVTVMVGGEEVKKVRLAGEDALIPLGRITADENGVYTIKDIEIAEGVTVTLNLSGTQNIGTGVYVYTSEVKTLEDRHGNTYDQSSQTFVGLASGTRTVNLEMNMSFDVEEPVVEKKTVTETQKGTRTDERIDSKQDTVTRTKTETKVNYEHKENTATEADKSYTADVTITRVTTKETKEEKSWISSWLKFFAPDPVPYNDEGGDGGDDDGGNDGGNGKRRLTTILDEEVPLANAPKTGDISALWAVISALSLGGMAVLSVKRKEEE